ncbi:MAG: TonB-dependent receptor domain-containing protein [Aquimonas sp.]
MPSSDSANVVVYRASDFAAFSPQTALDMVRRTPGFVLDEGNSDIRGYGAAGGNVLIDGARPVSKAGVVDALARIAASQVDRLELLRNVSTAEAQGQSLIVNVVRQQATASATWSVEVERNGNGRVYPRLDASGSRAIAGWETSLRVNAFWEEFPFHTVREVRDASGALLSSVVTDLPSTLTEAYISAEASRPMAGGVLKLSSRFGRSNYYFVQPGEIFLGRLPDERPDRRQTTRYDSERWDLELGGDYVRDVGDWSWKSLGVLTRKQGTQAQSEPLSDSDGRLLSNALVDARSKPLEVVVRSTLAQVSSSRFKPEFGIEAAFNRLDSAFALALDEGMGPLPIALPGANVRVEERRVEAFARARWLVTSAVSLEGELAAEASRISVAGDVQQTQSFSFLKPSLALSWRLNAHAQWQLGARRRVGQLDFADFAASASLGDATVVAGNPDLGPDQATRYFTSFDYRGNAGLAANLEIFHEDREDVLEQILLPSGAAGLANAGAATYRGVKGSLTLPLDALLQAARLTLDGQVLESAFDDPLIDRQRPLSRVYSPLVNAEFRHDPAEFGFSWGLTWESANVGEVYRVVEIDRLRTGRTLGGFIETGAFGGYRTRIGIRNLGSQNAYRDRSFFQPDRSGELQRTEDRRQSSPWFITITLSGSF